MKFSASVLALSAVAACAATAAAFTVVPSSNSLGGGLSGQRKGSSSASSASSSSSQLNMTPVEEAINSAIESNDVVVFSKSYCPFCTSTKELFKDMGVDAKVIELNEIGEEGPEYQFRLTEMTGQRTVPNVFVKGQHIGGNDDTQAAAKQGKLQEMLGQTTK